MTWVDAGPVESIPRRGARVLRVGGCSIALFRTTDDRVYALEDRCPHRGGPLSQGLVHGHCVTCPLHDWVIDLESGEAMGPDEGTAVRFDVRIDDGRVRVSTERILVSIECGSSAALCEAADAGGGEPPTASNARAPL